MSSEEFLCVLKKISVPDKATQTSGTRVQFEDTKLQSEGESLLITLWLRFFLLTYFIHGPGEDPFEAVMCSVGAASQISYCLLKIVFLIQNITWISAGFQNNKPSLY